MLHALRASIILLLSASTFAWAQDSATTDLTRLRGTWTVTAAERGGKPFDVIVGGVLKIDGDSFALRTAKDTEVAGKIQLDTTTSTKQLDFMLSTGAVWEAIYLLNADVLRLNYVERGDSPRPTVFATMADIPGTIIVMRKTAPP